MIALLVIARFDDIVDEAPVKFQSYMKMMMPELTHKDMN